MPFLLSIYCIEIHLPAVVSVNNRLRSVVAKVLHDQVIFLGQQLEQEREANRENRASSLVQLIPEPPEPPQSPEKPM
jgi:hypothetical protein